MESKAETEDEAFPLPTEKPKKPPTRTRNLFNTMWETSCNLSSNTEVSSFLEPSLQEETAIYMYDEVVNREKVVQHETTQPLQDNLQNSDILHKDLSLNLISEENISKLFSTMDMLLENQKNMMENQLKIIKQLSKQQTTLDMMMSNTSSMKAQTIVSTKTFTLPSPFSTIESLQDLEIKLGNEDNFQSFINSYKHVLSNDGRCNGKTGCYKLIDKIFTRELLTKYSWSGGSRDKVIKYSFKQYERIISAFYAIVKNVDSSFSYESCISFFQTVIRNATRRIENDPKKGKMVISRASSGRNRTLTNKKDDETRKENEIGEGNNDNLVTIQPQENNLI